MGRRVPKLGECFGIHPRCALLIEALQRGYVRDSKRSDAMPLKDGTFDHQANALEYLVEGFAGSERCRAAGWDGRRKTTAQERS